MDTVIDGVAKAEKSLSSIDLYNDLLQYYLMQYLQQKDAITEGENGQKYVSLEAFKDLFGASIYLSSSLLDTLEDTSARLDLANGKDQTTSSIPSGASRYGPNGTHPWNGFIGRDKQSGNTEENVNSVSGEVPPPRSSASSSSDMSADKNADGQESEDPFLEMLKDPKKSVTYLMNLKEKGKESRKKPGALSLPDPETAEYHVIVHEPEECSACPIRENCRPLKKAPTCGTFYILRTELTVHVDKHESKRPRCPIHGGKIQGTLPDGHASGKGYDDSIVANAIHTCMCGNASRRHTVDILSGIYGIQMGGKSSIDNWIRRMANNLREDRIPIGIRNSILAAYVLCLDETGRSVNGKLWWIHAVRAPLFMYFHIHKKRGFEGISAEDWITWYEGYASHDFWKAYYKLPGVKDHILCCIHLLRELFGIVSFMEEDFEWAAGMMTLLIKTKSLRDEYIEKGENALPEETVKVILSLYDEYINMGLAIHPEKNGKVRALLNRLKEHKDEYTRWIVDFKLPFTNNDAESSLRALVAHEKTSGAFRSEELSEDWMLCISYIGSCKLHGIKPIDAIYAALKHESAKLLFPEGIPDIPENCLQRKMAAEEKRRQEEADAEKQQQKGGKKKGRKKKAEKAKCQPKETVEEKTESVESAEQISQSKETVEEKIQPGKTGEDKCRQEESFTGNNRTEKGTETKTEIKTEAKTETKAEGKTETKAEAKTEINAKKEKETEAKTEKSPIDTIDSSQKEDGITEPSISCSDREMPVDNKEMPEVRVTDSVSAASCADRDAEQNHDTSRNPTSSETDTPVQEESSTIPKKPKRKQTLHFADPLMKKAMRDKDINGDSDSDQTGGDQSPEEKKPLTKRDKVERRRRKLEAMIIGSYDFKAEYDKLKSREGKQEDDVGPPTETACSA